MSWLAAAMAAAPEAAAAAEGATAVQGAAAATPAMAAPAAPTGWGALSQPLVDNLKTKMADTVDMSKQFDMSKPLQHDMSKLVTQTALPTMPVSNGYNSISSYLNKYRPSRY
jgi:hypothetical protein